MRSDAIDQETLKSYPPLFTASNIKISETSENILTQKLVEILAIKPTDYSQSVIQFLQSVSASQPELINLPSVQSFTSANNAQSTQTPINNPINPNLAQLGNGGVMGPGTPGPQNVMLQAMQPPQQMQAQPPQQMQQMPMNMGGNANGMFVSPQELAQKQAQPQMAQMQSNNVGSNDLLNQLISGKRLAAAN